MGTFDQHVITMVDWLEAWSALSLAHLGFLLLHRAIAGGRTASVPYSAGVSDNRGGGASGQNFVTVLPVSSPDPAPSGTLTVSNAAPAAGTTITVNFPVSGTTSTAWDIWAGGPGGASGTCCFTGSAVGLTFGSAGVYRVGTQAMDNQLNTSTRYSTVVKVGGATGEPPLADAVLDKLSGPVPFTVNIDLSGSTDADGTVQWYYFICNGGGFTAGSTSAQGSCTYTTPGTYWIMLQVQDNSGNVDLISAYVVAAPAGGAAAPPTVSITSPASGANVSGTASLTATASGSSAVSKVEYRLDSTSGTSLGSATASPYSVPWDTTKASTGAHMLYAVVTDTLGNTGASAGVNVNVMDTTPPSVSIASPGNGTSVSGVVTLTATASDLSGITKVQYFLGNSPSGTLIGSGTVAPYNVSCDTSALSGAQGLYAVATDGAGNTGVSAPVNVTVTAIVPVRPVVGITNPANATKVNAKSSVTISASLTNSPTYGVAHVDFTVNGITVCSDTLSPYTCSWKVPPGSGKTYTITATGTDNKGVAGPAASVTVSSK
jgi:hypothetical protein